MGCSIVGAHMEQLRQDAVCEANRLKPMLLEHASEDVAIDVGAGGNQGDALALELVSFLDGGS